MGLYDDVRETLDGTHLRSGGDALGPVDPDDPAFSPIHGVTLDRYAELSAALAGQGLAAADLDETWPEVDREWARRMAAHPEVRARYEALMGR